MARLTFLFLIMSLAVPPLFGAPVRLLKSASGWNLVLCEPQDEIDEFFFGLFFEPTAR